MWKCKVCHHEIEDEEDFCYHCGSDKAIAEQKAERSRARRLDTSVQCLRCQEVMRYAGFKKFHEGSRGWGFWLSDLGELFTHREGYDLYVCPRCGRVELFVDGIGEAFRGEEEAR